MKIKKVVFHYYKAFKRYTVELKDFNVLVGPNNAGKSTILGAFRILSEGIRKANSKSPERVEGPNGNTWGYRLELQDIPVSLENVFFDYNEAQPAKICFHLENGNRLVLFFPERDVCYLIPKSEAHVGSPKTFKSTFPVQIGFVPILGPVEHKENLYQKEAARKALLTHKASRNFRNIWHHYPEGFDDFREMIRTTWPGMDIDRPEIIDDQDGTRLAMFCPEDRVPREIYWAGFGFQVWCQMLTFILKAKHNSSTVLIIDEPDIYLHSDLQRQLVHLLQELDLQILIATHSVEIITEVESSTLLSINKNRDHARRITRVQELQEIYQQLGSNANPVLTQLAKTRRALFVEGKDFQILSLFARKLKLTDISNRATFAVIPVEGFNPLRVKHFSEAMEITLGAPILKGVIFDRDYRSMQEISQINTSLEEFCDLSWIHGCKEIENYLLNPEVLDRAITTEFLRKGLSVPKGIKKSSEILEEIVLEAKSSVMGQYLERRRLFQRENPPTKISTDAIIMKDGLDEFEKEWMTFSGRLNLSPGKKTLSEFNSVIQTQYGISLSQNSIIEAFTKKDIPAELIDLFNKLKTFKDTDPPGD